MIVVDCKQQEEICFYEVTDNNEVNCEADDIDKALVYATMPS
jgi:hypothetical protein